jgi:hypothetical protein
LEKLFRGKFKTYKIHFEDEDINLTADITKTTESWRPKQDTFIWYREKIRNLIGYQYLRGKLTCPTTMITMK